MQIKQVRSALVMASSVLAPIGAAHASDVDVFWVPNSEYQLKAPGGDEVKFSDGSGYGARIKADVYQGLFLRGEWETSDFDNIASVGGSDVGLHTKQYRAGIGYDIATTPFYVLGEYVGLESKFRVDGDKLKNKDEGYGAHLGAKGKVLQDFVTLQAELGYLDVGDASGLEALAGVAVNFTPNFSAFGEYRYTDLSGGNDPDLRLNEARVGLRASF